jgi:hypothetical protein
MNSKNIALASVIIVAVLAVGSSSYTVQAKESSYCYFDNQITTEHCGLTKEQCKDALQQASKDLNASCAKQPTTK